MMDIVFLRNEYNSAKKAFQKADRKLEKINKTLYVSNDEIREAKKNYETCKFRLLKAAKYYNICRLNLGKKMVCPTGFTFNEMQYIINDTRY